MAMKELLTDVESEHNCGWENQSTNQIDEHNKLHTKAEGTAKISHKNKFHEVMHCTVDPSTSLRQ